jgi:hypothetical protein
MVGDRGDWDDDTDDQIGHGDTGEPSASGLDTLVMAKLSAFLA